MKNKDYRYSKLKHQILYEKDKGKKVLYWDLTPDQRRFVEEKLGCKTEPYLYQIRTRTFFNISKLEPILKDVHYASKNKKTTIVRRLNKSEMKALDMYGVQYRPIKYKLDLTTIRR